MARRRVGRNAMRAAAERVRGKGSGRVPAQDRPLENTMGFGSGALPDQIECPDCAELIKARAKVCRFCGAEITSPKHRRKRPASRSRGSTHVHHHHGGAVNPGAAALLSLLIPGGGQVYAGDVTKGLLLMFLGAPVVWVVAFLFAIPTLGMALALPLVFYIWVIYDAHSSAASKARRSAYR